MFKQQLTMPTWLTKLLPRQIQRRGILLESLVFVLVYALLLLVTPAGSPLRLLVENWAILVASATATVLIFFSLPSIPKTSQRAWLMLGAATLAWLVADFLSDLLASLIGNVPAITSAGHLLNLLAYLLAGAALLQYPFRSQHAPTRFRFILDALISAGVVLAIGLLVLVRPLTGASALLDALLAAGYPIADCILLILLANFALANWVPRSTAKYLGAAWTVFLISDYLRSSLVMIGNYSPGGFVSLGWIAGFLLIGLGAIDEEERPTISAGGGREPVRGEAGHVPGVDLGIQFQKVLPIALVLVLLWYVLSDWRLRGEISLYGVWMSVLLCVMLIVRLGIRAGEAELNQYWQLFRNLALPSFVSDSNGNILLENPAYAALSKRPEQTVRRQHSLFEMFDGPVQTALEKAARRDETCDATLRGRGTPYSLSLSPIVTEGRRVLIAGVAHDLSEQTRQRDAIQGAYNELKKVYGALETLNAQLEQKVVERTGSLQAAYKQLEEQHRILQGLDEIKSDFVSMVSHELRAPLTNLSGGLELLLSRQHTETDQKTLLLIQAEIRRLTRFVESILNVSAMEAGRFLMHPIGLSLPAILGEVRAGWSNLPELDRIMLDVSDDLPLVQADENALRSVFGHLIDNALKYAPQSDVRVHAYVISGRVRVDVRDFGPGIAPEKQGLLFERFQRLQAKDSQAVYGYGLGLYLSRQLLRAMGSDLCFEQPTSGSGALLYFTLGLAE